MNSHTAAATNPTTVNGVDVAAVNGVIKDIQADTRVAQFQFRARNKWVDGALNRSQIQDYKSANQETTHEQGFTLTNDEPPILDGADSAPNPVEYVLHGLAGCLTTTMIYHAAVRDIHIDSCESYLEGDLDLRGIFGLDEKVRKGFGAVRVVMKVKTEASTATLRELASFSPVYDIVSNSLPVELKIEKV